MHKLSLAKSVLVIAVGPLLLTGCVIGEVPYQQLPPPIVGPQPGPAPVVVEQPAEPLGTEIVVVGPPPAVYQERITVSPGVGFVWIPGVWVWGGGQWVWQAGHWARPPRPGMRWIAARYVFLRGRHVFIHGGWR